MNKQSEIEKIAEHQDESTTLSGFLEWLGEGGFAICRNEESPDDWQMGGKWVPVQESSEQLLANYFDIDLDKVEVERVEHLERIRAQHASKNETVSDV